MYKGVYVIDGKINTCEAIPRFKNEHVCRLITLSPRTRNYDVWYGILHLYYGIFCLLHSSEER